MKDHTNSNGLVHGDIPAGDPCPWHDSCHAFNEGCPSPENLKPHPFSCALARLHSIILNGPDGEKFRREVLKPRQQRNPNES